MTNPSFVPVFLEIIGIVLLVFGLFMTFGSREAIEKYLKWIYSFSPISPKKTIKGRPLKAIRFNGVLILVTAIFLLFFGMFVSSQMQSILHQ